MSHRLLILRHAKSDWNASFASDVDRPLSERGVEAAGRIGRFVAAEGVVPDVVMSSPAVRARTTAELAIAAGGWERELRIQDEFYGGGGAAVLGTLQGLSAETGSAIIVGHQPIWSSLVGSLTGGSQVRFPTAALACLGFEGPWSDLDWGGAELLWLVTPKLLGKVVVDR